MPLTDLTDSDGNHFKVLEVDGYYLPNFGYDSQEIDFLKRVDHWQTRDDDIMICNYPKSGTHWIWEIVQMLYRQQAEFVNVTKDDWMIECITKEKFDGLTSPRILNSHLYHSMLPKDFLIDYKSWFDYVRDWCKVFEENKDYPIHVINYEDMHTNNIKEIKRLAEFLCIKCEDQLIGEIGTKCQIENMKREKIQNNEDWRDNTAGMYREVENVCLYTESDHLTMPLKDLVDSERKCMTVLYVDGLPLPDFKFPSQENDIQSMKDHYVARDDDVMLCNYPKSGTHWVWEIIQMLYTQKAELIEHSKMKGMIEKYSMPPKDFLRRKCKIVYTLRYPKDVAFSYYHHHRGLLMYNYDGSWDGYLERFLEGKRNMQELSTNRKLKTNLGIWLTDRTIWLTLTFSETLDVVYLLKKRKMGDQTVT
ncbi:Hypothetical predicted protein, partial [Mytilus galloprovincialis]